MLNKRRRFKSEIENERSAENSFVDLQPGLLFVVLDHFAPAFRGNSLSLVRA
jgi:hypothetical protein